MSMTGIILAAVVVGGTGLFIGVFLGIAGKKFAVKVDEREEAILGVLPGNNCGGCGYAGCSGLAAAIVKGEAEVSGCPVGGAPVAAKIGDIMGVAAGTQERQTAFVKCAGTCEKASLDYDYTGIQDCTMASMMHGTQISFRAITKKPMPISSVTDVRIVALVRTVMPFFLTNESRCFLYMLVLINQSCSFCDELAKKNTVSKKNGTVGSIGNTIPMQPNPRHRQPAIRNIIRFTFMQFSPIVSFRVWFRLHVLSP